MDYKQQYDQEVILYNSILNRYRNLKEDDILGAFNLMKDSLMVSERWSVIKEDYKKLLKRGEKAAEKERINDMYKILQNIHDDAKAIWKDAIYRFKNKEGY
ncbi:hypothetical protein [Clostridium baratii]|uniref:hypothetical protein n=1 Tax=Clostridium baratii TaxID=1561 RepID=UPI0006BB423D|nr:hypothetical protein [Clostridium baratii]